jgi:hypothetical protein
LTGAHLVLNGRKTHPDPVAFAETHDHRSVEIEARRGKLARDEAVPLVAEYAAHSETPFKSARIGKGGLRLSGDMSNMEK